ncbi:MAG: ABC transporter permease, partial [Cycloclasticus pugetii]
MLFSLTIFNTLTVVSALLYIIGACLIVVNLNSTEPTFKSQRQWVLISAILAIVIHTSLVAHSYSVNQIIA